MSGAAAALAFAGCASVAPPTPPDREQLGRELPAAWSRPVAAEPAAAAAAIAGPVAGGASSTVAGAGWAGVSDPLLAALVSDALAANAELASARAALAQSRALLDLADAGRRPQLGSSASAGRSRSGEIYRNQLSVGLDASWEADFFGRDASASAAAAAEVESAAAALQASRLAVAANTAIAYLQWRGTREALAIARESTAAQQQTQQLVEWRVQAGLASAVDAEQARANLEQTRSQLPALETTLQQTAHALAVLTGRPPATLAARLDTAPAAAPTLPTLPAGVPADLLRRRPDVLAAEWDIASSLATLDARRAERLPSFRLSGSLALQAASWSALGGAGAVAAGLAAGVGWPVFDGGATRAQIAAQQAAVESAQARYRATVLAALTDVEDSLVALDRGRERVAALERAADAAAAAAELARARYQGGLIDFGTLLDAERSLLSARSALSGARTDIALATVRLHKGLGGEAVAANER